MVWALKSAPVPADDPLAHLVLIGLADHAHDDGREARPTVGKLAEYARCSSRTVHNKLRVLEAVGLIRRGDQALVAHLPANRRPVVYDLAVGVQHVHPNGGAPVAGVNGGTSWGERGGRLGVNRSADRTVPEPSCEPSVPSARTAREDPAALVVVEGGRRAGTVTAQTIVGDWIDALDRRPPGRVVGHVSREVKGLLGEGYAPDVVAAGLSRWQDRGLHPAALPSVVHEVSTPRRGTDRQGQILAAELAAARAADAAEGGR